MTYDEFVRTDGDELWDRIRASHARFADLVARVPADHRASGSDWSTQQVAAHVLTVLRRYTERDVADPGGLSADVRDLARQNEEEIVEFRQMSVPDLLDGVAATLDRVEERLPRDVDLHLQFPFHGGQQLDAAAALGNLVGEFLLHGRDVARAAGHRWPLGSRDAALVLNVGIQVVAGYVAPDPPGDLSLEIRTPQTRPWLLELADGALRSRPSRPGDRVDVRLYGRSQAILLNLYGRVGLVGATLRGTAVVGGRRPWRVARLPRSFLKP